MTGEPRTAGGRSYFPEAGRCVPDFLSTAAALVIDECYAGDGLVALDGLKRHGCCAPAIILATNPTVKLRARVAAANAELIEKPLLGDELSSAIRAIFETRKAA